MKVCFVAPGAYPLFDPSVRRPIGGIETRSALFARGLARRPGFDVHFLVDDCGQPDEQRIDGVCVRIDPAQRRYLEHCESLVTATRRHANRVRECLPRKAGFPWFRAVRLGPGLAWDILAVAGYKFRFRFFPPCLKRHASGHRVRPREVYRQIGAELCIGFGVNGVSAEMIASCRQFGGVSVLFLASDTNLSTQYVAGSRGRDPEGEIAGVCHYALAHADFILTQTALQRQLLRERFGRDAWVVRNPIALDEENEREDRPAERSYVLWIGRADRHSKRPGLCLDVAARCPEVPFLMIMNDRHDDVAAEIHRRRTPNVRIVERVPAAEMPGVYRGARALVNTSNFEGFPNTFLQAGKFGVPVLSLEVDPDGMLQGGCGLFAAGSVERLAEHVRTVWHNAGAAAAVARRMRDYLEEHHEAEGRIDELAAVCRQFAGQEAVLPSCKLATRTVQNDAA